LCQPLDPRAVAVELEDADPRISRHGVSPANQGCGREEGSKEDDG